MKTPILAMIGLSAMTPAAISAQSSAARPACAACAAVELIIGHNAPTGEPIAATFAAGGKPVTAAFLLRGKAGDHEGDIGAVTLDAAQGDLISLPLSGENVAAAQFIGRNQPNAGLALFEKGKLVAVFPITAVADDHVLLRAADAGQREALIDAIGCVTEGRQLV